MRPDVDAGFAILPAVFGSLEIARILAGLEQASPERSRAGARHLMERSSEPRLLRVQLASACPSG